MSTPVAVDEAELQHQLGRRRVFVFFFAFTIVALLPTALGESDMLTHFADDVAIIVLAAIALALIASWWRQDTVPGLQRLSNALLMIAIIELVIQIGGIYIERTDAADFANEIPSLLFILTLIINRAV